MFVALSMVGVQAVGINRDIHFIGSGIFFVKGKRTLKIFKRAIQPAVSEVLNAEIDEGMLALFINFVIGGNGRTCGE
ncbi:hypothetical protein D3C72_2505680 [compost metagenome]